VPLAFRELLDRQERWASQVSEVILALGYKVLPESKVPLAHRELLVLVFRALRVLKAQLEFKELLVVGLRGRRELQEFKGSRARLVLRELLVSRESLVQEALQASELLDLRA